MVRFEQYLEHTFCKYNNGLNDNISIYVCVCLYYSSVVNHGFYIFQLLCCNSIFDSCNIYTTYE